MDDDTGIITDPLAVGLTRPTTRWGVTYPALILNMVVTVEAFVWTRNLFWLLMCLPIHGVSYLICQNEPRTFELLVLWARTKARTSGRTRGYWSASSYSPLTHRKPLSFIERIALRRRQRRLTKEINP